VQATVPAARLLVFNVKEGWAPLCAFLEKEVPDSPFPFVNEAGDIEFARKAMITLTYAWIPAAAAVLASGAFLFRRGFGGG
jgi:hypothetical protein